MEDEDEKWHIPRVTSASTSENSYMPESSARARVGRGELCLAPSEKAQLRI